MYVNTYNFLAQDRTEYHAKLNNLENTNGIYAHVTFTMLSHVWQGIPLCPGLVPYSVLRVNLESNIKKN